jgi:hypothetical protein
MSYPNILTNLTQYVKEELDKENIPPDAKYALVGSVDSTGARIMATVQIHKFDDKFKMNVAAVWHHDWDGNDTAGMKLIFVGK